MAETLPSPSGSFFAELKHRKVYHTAVTYAAAVFVIWQGADIAFGALGLPASFMRFLVVTAILGFPVAVALSWVLEVIPQRPLEVSGFRFPLPPLRPTLGALGLVLALGIIGWTVVPHQAAEVTEGEWVLLADLRNETGNVVFDGALEEALRLSLSQSPQVNVVSSLRVREALARMRRSEDTPLDEAVAVELAMREGITAVVVPSIRQVGRQYSLGARIVAPATGEVLISRSVRAAGVDAVLSAMDELSRQLRSDLGESLTSLVRRRIRLDLATTRSLEALKAWTEANRHASEGRGAEAGTLYRRAVELDSTFALARADLGQWYYWHMGDPHAGNAQFEAALRHANGVTERERLIIEGKAAEWRGDRNGAVTAYRAVTALLPEDQHAWSNLAYQYLRLSRHDEAIQTYERVLELDSMDAGAWANLATVHFARSEYAVAVPLYRRAFALQPAFRTNPGLNEEFGHVLMALGRVDEAESLYAEMLGGDPGARARGLRSMALLRIFKGHHREAADLLRQAVVLQEAGGIPVSEFRDRCFLATVYLRLGRRAEALAELRAARELASDEPIAAEFLVIAGVLMSRNGQADAARRLLDLARERSDDGVVHRAQLKHLEGEIALVEGEPGTAVEALREALTLSPDNLRLRMSLARAQLATRNPSAAADEWARVIDAGVGHATREALEEWILAHLDLARVRESLGEPDDARRLYRVFLGFWEGGDPELGEVREARSRLEALGAGG